VKKTFCAVAQPGRCSADDESDRKKKNMKTQNQIKLKGQPVIVTIFLPNGVRWLVSESFISTLDSRGHVIMRPRSYAGIFSGWLNAARNITRELV
jgi:hypothetical protein